MKLKNEFPKDYKPENVKQLCEENRWAKNGILTSSVGSFNNVPERFEEIAASMPAGSAERARYETAGKEADEIYRQQILSDIRKFSNGKGRAELESAANRMRHLSGQYEKSNPATAGRMMWCSYMIGDWYMQNNPSRGEGRLVSGKDQNGTKYQQFRAK